MNFLRWFFRCSPRTLRSPEAYHLWAASYPARAHNSLMQIEQAAVLSLLPDVSGKIVLDLACGTGRYGLIALERGAARVIGLDNSLDMLRAGELSPTTLATMNALPLPDKVTDTVICGLAMGHLPDMALPLREISRILKPGGTAVVSDFHPFQALNGAKRTFRAPDGRVFAVEHYAHLYSDYHYHAAKAGLRIDTILEPCLPEAGNVPVVIVYRMTKV